MLLQKSDFTEIILYAATVQDGVMVPVTREEGDGKKHNLKQVGNKYVFTIKNLGKDDAGLYSVDVGGVNVFSTEFKGMLNMFSTSYLFLQLIS